MRRSHDSAIQLSTSFPKFGDGFAECLMVQAVRTWAGRTLYVRQQWGRYLFEAGRITSGLSVVDRSVRPNLGNHALSVPFAHHGPASGTPLYRWNGLPRSRGGTGILPIIRGQVECRSWFGPLRIKLTGDTPVPTCKKPELCDILSLRFSAEPET